MTGLLSRDAGALIVPVNMQGSYTCFDLPSGAEIDPLAFQLAYSSAQDWDELECVDVDSLLATATSEYWLSRSVSLLRVALRGIDKSMEKRVFEDVEEQLGFRFSAEDLLDRLLVAPLKNREKPIQLANSALSSGFSGVASVLNELSDLQPLLQRFTDLWLELPPQLFQGVVESREEIWATLAIRSKLNELLKVEGPSELEGKWNLLAFHFKSQRSRAGVTAIGKQLALQLFPEKTEVRHVPTALIDETDFHSYSENEREPRSYEAYERAKKQVAAIVQAVSTGHEAKARKFLGQLIEYQVGIEGGEAYAVMSLCNIAKQCADLFRTDFELVCLEQALRLRDTDTWTLIQYGDHLKRVGKYEEALQFFSRAEQSEHFDIARSSVADVYSQQGYYTKAIRIYESIDGWQEKPSVLTGIADNLRRMGRYGSAQRAYDDLLTKPRITSIDYQETICRALAGMAEIAKRQGRLDDALRGYLELLAQIGTDDRSALIYNFGLFNIYKRLSRFDDAYSLIEEVVRQFPFSMQARFQRGSILGLIGREQDGLKDLPATPGARSWREWLRPYYRGLLLLRLREYGDARKNLIEELPLAIASGEERDVLRMAAALWFLSRNETPEADGILSKIPYLRDRHSKYLLMVLKLHSATRQEDAATMKILSDKMTDLKGLDENLDDAVAALADRNFAKALTCETDALLKFAA